MEGTELKVPITPRKESAKGDATASTFAVSQRWFAESRLKALLVAIAIASPLLSLWYIHGTVVKLRDEMWVWNLDHSGVITFAPLGIVDANSKVFREIVMQACEVYLKRNPAGLSNVELLPRYFSDTATKAVKSELAKSNPERNRRNLFDQPEFTKQPERIDSNSGSFRYRVVGYVVRTGVIDGMVEREVGDFRIGLELEPSDSVREKGRFPFVVKQFRKVITWRTSGKSEEFESVTGEKPTQPQSSSSP